jgi:hypothetical protein
MLAKLTPLAPPTVGASALVETYTWLPAAMTTLLPFVGATSTLPVLPSEAMMRHVPLGGSCHRFSAPLA